MIPLLPATTTLPPKADPYIETGQKALSGFFVFLDNLHPLPSAAKWAYTKQVKLSAVKKNKFILSPIEPNQYLYFLVKGTARGFVRNGNRDITTWFAFENELMGVAQNPSPTAVYSSEYIQAIEDCVLVSIPYQFQEALCVKYDEVATMFRKILSLQIYRAGRTAHLARIPKAIDRYRYLLKEEREEFSNLPLRFLSSYLGMRIETLSRIRNKGNDTIAGVL